MFFSYDDMRRIIFEHLADTKNQARALDTAIMSACRAAFDAGRQCGREEAVGTQEKDYSQ